MGLETRRKTETKSRDSTTADRMLLWWKLDSVPLPLVIKPKVVKEASASGGASVTSIKPNRQANLICNAITSFLSFENN